jgi:hypothetical protein
VREAERLNHTLVSRGEEARRWGTKCEEASKLTTTEGAEDSVFFRPIQLWVHREEFINCVDKQEHCEPRDS